MKESERLRKKCMKISARIAKKYQSNPDFAVERITIIWEFYSKKIKIAQAMEDILDRAAKLAGGMALMECRMRRLIMAMHELITEKEMEGGILGETEILYLSREEAIKKAGRTAIKSGGRVSLFDQYGNMIIQFSPKKFLWPIYDDDKEIKKIEFMLHINLASKIKEGKNDRTKIIE